MGWPERLDAIDRLLHRAARTVEYGAPADRGTLPDADGPLPGELLPRATALLAALADMESAVRDALADADRRLCRLTPPSRAASPAVSEPAFIDAHA